ncbi:hypothetical protein BpHYR1_023271 [Brachionus plicatilis]|uniref:Uncharacterized protein n=1 Tax=Brachionus plicatilis TaxID=10195 RepID=A0A3M7Q532_BRAPC|nr:hypothetical protein BpHYR1_023271 [Brachionus plicatilis]
MENTLITEERHGTVFKNFVSTNNLLNEEFTRLKNNYFSNDLKTWTRFPRIRRDSLSGPDSLDENVAFFPSEVILTKKEKYLPNEIPVEKTFSSPFLWYFKSESRNESTSQPRNRLPSIQKSESRKSSETKEIEISSVVKKSESTKSIRWSVDSAATSDDEVFEKRQCSMSKKKSSKKRVSIQEPIEEIKSTRKSSILSDDDLRNLKISDKFLAEAKNMIYFPDSNSFCPHMKNRKITKTSKKISKKD